MDWHAVNPTPLFEAIRERGPAPDAERMVWALEQILGGARVDPELLDHLAAAAICALAYRDGETPREVLETLLRRAVSDERWSTEFAPLIAEA